MKPPADTRGNLRMRTHRWILQSWLLLGELRAHPGRATVAMAAIALGVALGFAIHLINTAAFNEFSAAARSLSGQYDLQLRGVQSSFDEALFPRLARHEKIALASPVLELDVGVVGFDSAREAPLKIIGLDVFRAAAVAPDLIGVPAEDRALDTLADDALFLSTAAQAWLQVEQDDTVALRAGTRTVKLRVAGGLTRTAAGQRLAVMDIGAMQWRFGRVGQLSRIDLKLKTGIDRAAFKAVLAQELGAAFLITETADQEARTANMSRAYRVNLNMLALVALFTGAFLVFSTQALSVIRRRSQLALLRVTGVTRRQLLTHILFEGALLGVAGSLLGIALGYAMATLALHFFGGDLGGGYFPGVQPRAHFSLPAAIMFFLLGTAVAILGCASPAWEAARTRPAQALKAGSEELAMRRLASPWPALAALLLAAVLAMLPPVAGLPLFGYAAVALLLIGGIALMPRLCAILFARLSTWAGVGQCNAVASLALARLANAPNQASIALGGVLSAFSLMVAMAIMVSSFRISVDDWLSHLLAADLYIGTPGGNTATLDLSEQQALAAAAVSAGAARIEFQRSQHLTLAPGRPQVTLIARTIDADDPGKTLPLRGESLDWRELPGNARPVWVSEAMVDLYAHAPGQRLQLPLGGRMHDFVGAGIWRDYARQSGAIQMRLEDYRALSGDMSATDAALWLRPDVSVAEMRDALQHLPFADTLEFVEPGEIRAISLAIFDRSFAVTYLLELVAIVIGLFGVAASFSAQTLARTKEFGMLRHVGVTRKQILAMLAAEGGLLAALGIGVGFVLGWSISLILVFVVNPQSFHWTMQLHVPWGWLGLVALVLLLSAGATALAAGRLAVSGEAVRAVREDW